MIPKVLHRIWVGGPMPAAYRQFGDKWKQLHPDWNFKLWGDGDFGWLRNQRLFDNAADYVPADAVGQFRSDLARYEILHRFGGVYVDCDSEPLRNHNSLLNAEMFAGWEVEGEFVANGVIGSVPGHPVLEEMINASRDNALANKGRAATWISGPRIFTPIIRASKQAVIYPKNYFYPYLYDEIKRNSSPELKSYPDSYSVHHWNHRRELRGRPLLAKGGAKLSVAIMAHEKRKLWVPDLERQLPDVKTVWDRNNDRWDTGARALKSYNPDAEWHLVVQDDALLPPDFYDGVARMLEHVPRINPVGLYYGRVRPREFETRRLMSEAQRSGAPFIVHEGPWWGVGIVLPVHQIDEVVEWGNSRPEIANYDRRIARWYGSQGIPCYYTFPSLIEHRHGSENPSLVPGRTSLSRRAWQFVGPRSALDVDWSGPVVASKQ